MTYLRLGFFDFKEVVIVVFCLVVGIAVWRIADLLESIADCLDEMAEEKENDRE